MLCTLGVRASATSSQWRTARTHFSSLTSFCKTRTASASQQVVLSTPARLWVIETKPAQDKLDNIKKPAQDKLDTIKPAQRLEPKWLEPKWRLMPQGNEWNLLSGKIMKTTLQAKDLRR